MKSWTQIGKAYISHGVRATAFRSKDASIDDLFEVGIFFGTYESRGLVSSSLLQSKSCVHSIIVLFNEAQNSSLRQKYDRILNTQVEQCSKESVVSIKDVSVKDIEGTLGKIISSVPSNCWTLDANWFIDLGGAPIPYFLGLIAYLRDMFPCPKLTIFNPTGDYGAEEMEYTFTSGFDRNIWVPRLWGRPDPILPWTYVFLLGFEGSRSYEVFYRCEPDHIKALIGQPGYREGYKERAIRANEMFLRESGLWEANGKLNIITSNAANPVETWEKLERVVTEERDKKNVCFVPLGPKGHALGGGLCALASGAPAVLYNMPGSYAVRDILRGEYLWKYEISL